MLVGGACLERCVFHAIAEENGNFLVNEELCMGCGVCHPACPVDAISLIEIRPADFIPD
jgi:Fe-S-cluster-containing hydrogenase component 2